MKTPLLCLKLGKKKICPTVKAGAWAPAGQRGDFQKMSQKIS